MKSIQFSKQFVLMGVALTCIAFVFILVRGLPLGVDFTGGSLVEVLYQDTRPELSLISNTVSETGITVQAVQLAGDRGVLVRAPILSDEQTLLIEESMESLGVVESSSFTTIGPSIGNELKTKALTAILVVAFVIILFVAYAFRQVSEPVSSWKYGVSAVVTLFHDVLVTSGVMTFVAWQTGQTFDSLFVVALLTILGLSINDTIVVFDRIRETLTRNQNMSFREVVSASIRSSSTRAINTSLTTILVLLALVFWGPASTSFFALTLAVGMAIGTYSSLFLASPLLVVWHEYSAKKALIRDQK